MINKNSYLNADYLSDNHSTYKDFFDGKKSGESDMTTYSLYPLASDDRWNVQRKYHAHKKTNDP